MTLEIDGKNAFESLSVDRVRSVVIMDSRERFIDVTLKMIGDLFEKKESVYEYWLLGTGFGFRSERKDQTLQTSVRVDGGMGPTQGVRSPQTVHIGAVPVNEWVESIVLLSKTLSDLFRRLNAETYRDPVFQRHEASLLRLEKWLSMGRNP